MLPTTSMPWHATPCSCACYCLQYKWWLIVWLQVRDQARRFITLVDELYNAHVRLMMSGRAVKSNVILVVAHPVAAAV